MEGGMGRYLGGIDGRKGQCPSRMSESNLYAISLPRGHKPRGLSTLYFFICIWVICKIWRGWKTLSSDSKWKNTREHFWGSMQPKIICCLKIHIKHIQTERGEINKIKQTFHSFPFARISRVIYLSLSFSLLPSLFHFLSLQPLSLFFTFSLFNPSLSFTYFLSLSSPSINLSLTFSLSSPSLSFTFSLSFTCSLFNPPLSLSLV